MTDSPLTDAQLARSIALEAGALLQAIRARGDASGKALGDIGDREANALIVARLRAARPDDFILSEEALDDQARCAASRVWIVDPLDGTREYAEGIDDWAVHIGLAIDGRPRIGSVAVPARCAVHTTDDVHLPLPAPANPPRMVVSRSRAPEIARTVALAMGTPMIAMGSAGAKAMAVVDGRAEIYLHDGGQYEWDNCAPAAVALASGLHASRIDGSPLVYNCADPLLPDLLICRPELAETVLAAIACAR
ncbi:3'(2'),5'-bisphosphate nucleotidase CysQ [Sphingomonas ginsenosidivorax]|uniref:3'(2'),5'-bisphosphate nucleotidase CysQ n=1 Tax=Sphingomonas ginsenosidivorax TaxID=862135 RepID=A0A5C6UD31_9SPHN|nr:3'(2'),5'-bisphosphate nucleotidase CysQ [Sphingomonas ginsenosidivorax]TXC70727.1 3'(2'),5'-bisphosphate nucleotidase CysQ [Sphingomonas ginsenosidivorax]